MLNTGNVVAIDAGSSDAQARVHLARLPAALHRLREKNLQLLQQLLDALFEQVDDALFARADNADSNQEQSLYFDSMREIRVSRRALVKAFSNNLDRAFSLLLEGDSTAEMSPIDSASAASLDLVKNDELEELVAVDSMVNKANAACAELIQHLTLRIDNQVAVKVYAGNNPLSPKKICEAFTAPVQSLVIDIKAKLVLFKLFDQVVMVKLGDIYTELNKLLIDLNILPSLQQDLQRSQQAKQKASRESAVYSQASETAPAVGDSGADFEALRQLLPAADFSTSVQAAPAVQLLSYLSQLQLSSCNEAAPLNLTTLSDEFVQRGGAGASISPVEGDVINLVNMLFEFILDDRNLPAAMKGLLARLQIPILKVALSDKSFFSRGGHPARRLMNEMATAALGWQAEDSEGVRQPCDRFYRKVEAIVERILSDYSDDAEVFSELLADFLSFVEKEQRRAKLLEQRTIDAEGGKAKSELARALVDEALAEIIAELAADIELPSVAQQLSKAWGNVMLLTALQLGDGCELWQQQRQTAHDLVWSLTAPLDKQNRYALLKLVPRLLKELRQGLESISYNSFELSQLFKQLEAAHMQRLRSQPLATAEKVKASDQNSSAQEPVAVSKTADEKDAVSATQEPEIESSVKEVPAEAVAAHKAPVVEVVAEPEIVEPSPQSKLGAAEEAVAGAEPSEISPANQQDVSEQNPFLPQVDALTQGSWFEMQTGADSTSYFRCRLAAIIRSVDKYIFVNRAGMKVAEKSRQELALCLQHNQLRMLDDSMLFDRALENVIGNLRESRGLV